VNTTGVGFKMDQALMVIVPHHLPARAAALTEALARTNIQVVVDRRHGERRRAHQPPDVQRRQGDRRRSARVVAYVYACPVISVETLSSPEADLSPSLEGTRLQLN
jgi:hypothetical protein